MRNAFKAGCMHLCVSNFRCLHMNKQITNSGTRRQQKHDMLLTFTANIQMKHKNVAPPKQFIYFPHLLLLALLNIGYRQLDLFNKYSQHFFN